MSYQVRKKRNFARKLPNQKKCSIHEKKKPVTKRTQELENHESQKTIISSRQKHHTLNAKTDREFHRNLMRVNF
ncbi:MAG: hypothetical protein ACW98F_06985 [Candidatus Hodarchaeales archaeon]|jgi:hypothetical protein